MQPPAPTLQRRHFFIAAGPALLAGTPWLGACQPAAGGETYAEAAARIRRPGLPPGAATHVAAVAAPGRTVPPELKPELVHELVRLATLAASSHNTQCWRFAVEGQGITILPDLSRRCPAVDPDDHHLFVSLGCAAENLAHAALAHGLQTELRFDPQRDAVQLALAPAAARRTALFDAIATRQCTRGDYDGQALAPAELALLESAGSAGGVRVLMLTARSAVDRVLEAVVQGNTAQMADLAFMRELQSWIRFNGAQALRSGDGLFSVASGQPEVPGWLGGLAFRWLFTPQDENDKLVRQMRSSAGVAVFVGPVADKAHWVDVGRAYERFALQATALGIRHAFVNQPVEVAALRPVLAAALGLGGLRPDLVLRFGRGPALPPSLRRPVQAVLA